MELRTGEPQTNQQVFNRKLNWEQELQLGRIWLSPIAFECESPPVRSSERSRAVYPLWNLATDLVQGSLLDRVPHQRKTWEENQIEQERSKRNEEKLQNKLGKGTKAGNLRKQATMFSFLFVCFFFFKRLQENNRRKSSMKLQEATLSYTSS